MIAKPVETALLVYELESCEIWWSLRFEIEGKLSVLPLNESVFGESAAAMAVDCSFSRPDFATSLTSHPTVLEARWQKKH